jgi:hypothetical protein
MGKTDRVYNTTHFKIYYIVLDDLNIKEIADSLENSYPKTTSHLRRITPICRINNELLIINSAAVRADDFQIPPHRQAVPLCVTLPNDLV